MLFAYIAGHVSIAYFQNLYLTMLASSQFHLIVFCPSPFSLAEKYLKGKDKLCLAFSDSLPSFPWKFKG